MLTLPKAFLDRPIAHRGFHDRTKSVIENSLGACKAAIEAGYGIELDLQLSRDGVAMMFHDEALDRLTEETGLVCQRDASDLINIRLRDCGETIPTFADVLAFVDGKVPLLVELKDQTGVMGQTDGRLEASIAASLVGYEGPVALMSFNPNAVAQLARLCPDTPRGITTCNWLDDEEYVPEARRKKLADIPDYDRVEACFISHDVHDLENPRVAQLKSDGATILCWTVRSREQERIARRVADNITFEGYAA